MSEVNVPKLRFREFEGEWVEKKLKDIATTKGGKRIPKGYLLESENNGYPYITVTDMNNGTVNLKNIRYVPLEVVNKIENYRITVNDIFISVAGTLGLVGIIPQELNNANLTENANKLTNLKINQKFLFQILNSSKLVNQIKKVTTIGAQPKLAIYAIDNFKFTIPNSSKEQQKIANFLTSIDQKIEQLTKKEKLLVAYKKGIMQKIFSQEIRFRDENGEVYGDWVETRLKDLLTYEQPTKYIVKSTEYKDKYETPVLTAGKTFVLGYTNEKNGIYKELPVIIFDDFTTANHYVNFDFKVKSSAMKILKTNNKNLNLKFIYEFIQTLHFPLGEHKRYWISEYSYLKINLPCLAEQTKIANFLSSIDKKIEQVNRQIEESKGFKKGLLQQMFV